MRKFLERYGWKFVSSRKVGCFKTVLWMDKDGGVWPQGMAVEIQRSRNKPLRRRKRKPAPVVIAPESNATATATDAPSVAFPATLPCPGYGVGWN